MKTMLCLMAFFAFTLNAAEITPTTRLNQSLSFSDDLNFENLALAIDRQLNSYDMMGLGGQIKFGATTYNRTILRESLVLLKTLAQKAKDCIQLNPDDVCLHDFNREMNNKFIVYQPLKKQKAAKTHFTSYYSPDMNGSRTPTEKYKNPIYRFPEITIDQNFTRSEIDFHGALAGKGYEEFWVEDSLYDIYLLQVQGGGRINIHDESGNVTKKFLSYDGKNNRSFSMLYKYMIAQGYLTAGNAGIVQQRNFLDQNPDKQEEIFNSCPSYVYFKESDEEPVGLNNVPLTEGRSLAIDSRIYKSMGLINFVKTQKASHLDQNGRVVKVPFSRFFIAQDTGGAIRGNARCDLYFGYGAQAELTAYNMDEIGEQYFLIKR